MEIEYNDITIKLENTEEYSIFMKIINTIEELTDEIIESVGKGIRFETSHRSMILNKDFPTMENIKNLKEFLENIKKV